MEKYKVAWGHFLLAEEVKKRLPPDGFEVVSCPSQGDLEKSVSDADFLVVGRYVKATREMIEKGKRLKLIQRTGRFYENRVDLEAATKARIPVAVIMPVMAIAVAETAMALMLALSKQLLEAHRLTISGAYEKRGLKPEPTAERRIPNANWMNMSPQVLYGKTLGIIGMGEIGYAVAERGKGFGMKVIYHDLSRLPLRYEQEVGAAYLPFETVLREADYVTVHVPHTQQTERLLDGQALSLMKKSAFLINCSRGGVIDEDALHKALERGALGGAGLDVYFIEPVPKDSPILKLKNVVLTPHIASPGALGIMDFAQICANIVGVANGESPLGVVT